MIGSTHSRRCDGKRIDRAVRAAIIVLALAVLAAGFATPAPSQLSRFEYHQRHMGVLARLVLYAPDEAAAVSAARAAFRRLAELDSIMSDYRPASELVQLSAVSAGSSMPIGEDLLTVLTHAQALAELSDGAFDVTVGPLVDLWREARRTGRFPSSEALADARDRTGWRYLRLDPEARTATLLLPAMRLDLGALGKGYAADETLAALAREGIDRALVELGGEIVVGDAPPGEAGWLIRLADAQEGRDSIVLIHAAVSSSGDTEQFAEIDGVRYSHIVDPRTGIGLTNRLLVTVSARSGLVSDALSTLVSVLGAEEGIPLATRMEPDARVWVRPAPSGSP